MSPSMLWGSSITLAYNLPTLLLGFAVHLFVSGCIGVAYSMLFEAFEEASPRVGLGIGIGHWIIAGILMTAFGVLRPVPLSTALPGWYGLNLGFPTFMIVLLAHLVFGVVMGTLYTSERLATIGATEPEIEEVDVIGEGIPTKSEERKRKAA